VKNSARCSSHTPDHFRVERDRFRERCTFEKYIDDNGVLSFGVPLKSSQRQKQTLHLTRWSYIKNLAEELKENNNPKPFWSFVKSARKGTNNLVSLLVDGVTLTDDLSIAESMSQFYSSVFTSEDCDNFPNFDYVVTSKLSNIYCSVNEIEKLLKNLNAYVPWACGLSPRILRECATALSLHLYVH